MMMIDSVLLEVYRHRFAAIPEEMGGLLRRSSFSPNIKERRDYSCALFNAEGEMIAQAAHIPVHLGSMPLSVAEAIRHFSIESATNGTAADAELPPAHGLDPGDVIVLNDPFRGGTHLPDITMISPVFTSQPGSNVGAVDSLEEREAQSAPALIGFVANRAHHADVGGMAPGSMAIASEIYQEGIIIPPIKLVRAGKLDESIWDMILANVRTPRERAGDLRAQLAANQRGKARLIELASRHGTEEIAYYMNALMDYSERVTRNLLSELRNGIFTFTDYLDDNGQDDRPVPITVRVEIQGDQAVVDFAGSAPQQAGGVNAVYAITLSAVYYTFRSLVGMDIPNNSGCLAPIQVLAPQGTVVNARHPAPVAGGNVETSQRIVDVLLGALAQASPERVPAASQGTMNNVTIGGWDSDRGESYTYYETIGGGLGARPDRAGASAVHSHMTNTLNTPIEALEYAYPLRVIRYEVRRGSGGAGRFRGGDGIRRDIQVQERAHVSLITERRRLAPYGLTGGDSGLPGENVMIRDGIEHPLPGKCAFELNAGDVLSIRTPGGGGYGKAAP